LRPSRIDQFPVGASISLDDLTNRLDDVLVALRTEGPVSWLPAIDGWFVTGWSAAVEVQRDDKRFTVDDERFSTAQVVGPSMLSLDGSEHRRHRQPFVAPLLRSAVNENLRPLVDRQAAKIVEQIKRRELLANDNSQLRRCDLRAELAAPLAVASIIDVLELPVTQTEVLSWYRAIVEAVEAISVGRQPLAPAQQARSELMAVVSEVSQRSRGVLHEVAETGLLSAEELASNVVVVMFGAIETGEGMIATAAFHLLTNPPWIESLKTNPSGINAFVEESLRLDPPAAVIDRYATVTSEISGTTIEAGELVRISLTGANRDPAVFDRPDNFDPTRSRSSRALTLASALIWLEPRQPLHLPLCWTAYP